MKFTKLLIILPILFLLSCGTDDSIISSYFDSSISDSSGHIHDYGDPIYSWNNDHTKLTATRTCLHDNTHIETETVDVDSVVSIEATCLEDGERTYTSRAFSNIAFSVQTYKEVIPAIGHDYASTLTFINSNTHGRKCDHCDEHIDIENHDYQITNLIYAHDNGTAFPDSGEITYTCSGCGHSYTEPYYHMEGEI